MARLTLTGSKDLLHSVVASIPVPTAITTLQEGRVLVSNEAIRRLMRVPARQQDPEALAPPSESLTTDRFYADPSRRAALVGMLEQQDLIRDIPFSAQALDGSQVHCLASFQRIRWNDQDAIIVCFVDMADRLAAEAALRDSEERYRQIAENTSDVVWQLDIDLHVTHFGGGRALMAWLGTDSVLGRSALDFFAPDSRKRLQDGWKARLEQESGGTQSGRARYEVQLQNTEGSLLWVELLVYPHRDQDGPLRGYFGIMRDISARKAAETALRNREHLFRQMFDADPVAKLLVDPETGVVLGANASAVRFHGRDSHSLVGVALSWLVACPEPSPSGTAHAPTPAPCRDPLALLTAAASDSGEPVELTYHRADGTIRRIAAHVGRVDVAGSDGRTHGSLNVSLFDVTDRVHYETSLRQHNTALRDFTTAVSHDLQEPLRMVSGYLGLLERRLGDRLDEDEREFMHYATDGAARMRSMILGLLDYARLDTRAQPVEPVALDEVVSTVSDLLARVLQDAGGTLHRIRPLPIVLAERRQMVSLFQNLIGNAIRYRDPARECRITLDWESLGERALVSVADTGPGIDPRNRERVFGVFQRLAPQGDTTEGSTGMGLAICRRIIDRHDGRIWVESAAGGGARFCFTLPLTRPGDHGTADALMP